VKEKIVDAGANNKRPELSARIKFVPTRPGVYIMRSGTGRVVYVGKAKNLKRRLGDYFLRKLKDKKTTRLVREVTDFEIHPTTDETAALLLEEKLILDFMPKYNVAGRGGMTRHWITLSQVGLPRFLIVSGSHSSSNPHFGPYPSLATAQWIVSFINRLYGLRSCSPENPTAIDFAHCLEHQVNRCSAPCVAFVSPDEYQKKVDSACAWLGQPRWRIEKLLRGHMNSLSKSLQFEKAAKCRDVVLSLRRPEAHKTRSISNRTTRDLARFQMKAFTEALSLDSDLATIEGFDVSHSGGKGNVVSLVVFLGGLPVREKFRQFRIPVDGANDPECIRQALVRRYTRSVLPEIIIVDGGLPQLSAAKLAMKELGKSPQCLLALAKQTETLFREDGTTISLPLSSPALHMAQRVRDEAHRVANSFTRRMASRQMRTSALTTIEGVGEKLAVRLMRKFGSVAGVAGGDVEELALVPGVGRLLALKIKESLRHSSS
jgi:excinuclease ABC subunit C